jgi:hypothetical protein
MSEDIDPSVQQLYTIKERLGRGVRRTNDCMSDFEGIWHCLEGSREEQWPDCCPEEEL